MKSASGDLLVVAARRGQGRLVGEVGEVGADHAGRRRGDPVEVDVVGERQRARVDLEDLAAPVLVGRRHGHAAVEAAGPQQRAVEDLRAVGGAEDDHRDVGLEAVHLGQDLVERLLALVVAAAEAHAAGARAPDGVELVDEDDRRRGLLGGLEEVADARGADADDRLDELRRRDREERHPRLPRDGLGQQRLAGAGLAGEQDAARDPPAELAVAVGVLEEVDDLGQLRLRLVDAGHVGEGDALLAALDAARLRARERAQRAHPGPAAGAAGEEHEQADQQDHRAEAEQEVDQQAARVDRLGLDDDAVLLQQLGELVGVGEGRDLGLEVLGRLLLPGRVVLLLELALDGLALGGDALDVAVLDLLAEGRVVGDVDRGLLARAEQRDADVVERQQDDHDHDEARARHLHAAEPAPLAALWRLLGVARGLVGSALVLCHRA